MANTFGQVEPGDLITAQFMNKVLTALDALDARVTALESGSGQGVAITGLFPTGAVKMGSELRIFGKNFALPALNVVTIEGVQVTQFKAGSNDGLLILDVPTIVGIPSGGKTVALTVSNPNGFAQTTLTVLPGETTVLTGQLNVDYAQAPSVAKLDPNGTYTFGFTIQAQTSMGATYTLTPTLNQSWQAVVVDSSGNVISPSEIQIPTSPPEKPTSLNVGVRLTIPVGATTGTSVQLGLVITAKPNPNLNNQKSISFKVGDPPPSAGEQKITIQLGNVFPPGQKVGGVIEVPATPSGGPDVLVGAAFQVTTQDAGTYTVVGPTVENDPNSLWKATLETTSADFPAQAGAATTINTSYVAQAGAPSTNVILEIQKKDDPSYPPGKITQPIRIKTS